MVKKNLFKYSSVLMCVVLTAASLVACGNSSTATTGTDTAVMQEMAGSTEETLTAAINNELAVSNRSTLATNTRQETVYVFGDASGNKNHITVNEKVTDASGNETLNKTESKENAPVTMKVTYMLNGKEMKPEDMAGKSGKVTIRFDYTNSQKKTVTVSGKKQTVAVPFTMITGMMLPTDVYSNVEVTNGKLTKVGDSIVALGMTMPGLSDTLNIKFGDEQLDIDIPEYFEVTADVKNFSLDMTLSVATSNLLSDMDVDEITLDDLKKTVASMDDAASQLAAGTVSLQEGTQKLDDSIPALTDGVSELNSGAATLKDGIYAYADGAATAYEGSVSLNDNMKAYAEGMGTLYSSLKDNGIDTKVVEAAEGAGQLYEGAGTLDAGIDSMAEGAGQLVTGADALSEGLAQLVTGADALSAGTTQLKSNLEAGKTQAESSYRTAYDSFYKSAFAVNCIKNGIDPDTASSQEQAAIAAAMSQAGLSQTADVTSESQYGLATGFILQNYNYVKQVVAASVNAAAGGQLDEATADSLAEEQIVKMTSGLSQAYQAYSNCSTTLTTLESAGYFTGVSSLNAGVKSANSGATVLNNGIRTLNAGTSQLSAGSKTLKAGLGTLSTGLNTLSTSVGSFSVYREGTLCSSLYTLNLNAGKLHNEGTAALKSGLSELTSNNDSLKSGASQLADGTATLKSSSATLAEGVSQLNAGAVTLKDGMAQFNSEAIEPISRLVNDDAQAALDRIKAVVKAGQEYNSFLGKSDDKSGSVTFVYKTAGITAEK